VQWDTSEHEWLEGRGAKLYLVGMIDDASSRALARFVEHDTTAENMRLVWRWLEEFGRPLEYYTDKAGLFQVNRPLHDNQRVEEAAPLTRKHESEHTAFAWSCPTSKISLMRLVDSMLELIPAAVAA